MHAESCPLLLMAFDIRSGLFYLLIQKSRMVHKYILTSVNIYLYFESFDSDGWFPVVRISDEFISRESFSLTEKRRVKSLYEKTSYHNNTLGFQWRMLRLKKYGLKELTTLARKGDKLV